MIDKSIEEKVEILVDKYLKDKNIDEDFPGYIEIYWDVKKNMLKEFFNIDWKTPNDINSDSVFN